MDLIVIRKLRDRTNRKEYILTFDLYGTLDTVESGGKYLVSTNRACKRFITRQEDIRRGIAPDGYQSERFDDKKKLARVFCIELRETLKYFVNDEFDQADKLIAEIVRRNIEFKQQPDYKGCCATHDFCDANMVMDAAFKKTMGREMIIWKPDGSSEMRDADIDLWNAAWTIAKAAEFDPTNIL